MRTRTPWRFGRPPPAGGSQTCDQAPAHAVLHATNRYKPHHPTPPNVDKASRYNSKRSKARPHHALAGRADLRDGRTQESLRLGLGGQGVASRPPPPRATTRQPRGRAT
jgi:hypothetical protein